MPRNRPCCSKSCRGIGIDRHAPGRRRLLRLRRHGPLHERLDRVLPAHAGRGRRRGDARASISTRSRARTTCASPSPDPRTIAARRCGASRGWLDSPWSAISPSRPASAPPPAQKERKRWLLDAPLNIAFGHQPDRFGRSGSGGVSSAATGSGLRLGQAAAGSTGASGTSAPAGTAAASPGEALRCSGSGGISPRRELGSSATGASSRGSCAGAAGGPRGGLRPRRLGRRLGEHPPPRRGSRPSRPRPSGSRPPVPATPVPARGALGGARPIPRRAAPRRPAPSPAPDPREVSSSPSARPRPRRRPVRPRHRGDARAARRRVRGAAATAATAAVLARASGRSGRSPVAAGRLGGLLGAPRSRPPPRRRRRPPARRSARGVDPDSRRRPAAARRAARPAPRSMAKTVWPVRCSSATTLIATPKRLFELAQMRRASG